MEVFSFTEKVLLSNNILNFICPIKCQEQKVNDTATESLHKTLENVEIKADFKKKPLWINSALRAAARVAIIAAIALVVAPCGVLVNGARTLSALAVYMVKKNDTNWKKVTDLSNVFFKDFRSFSCGLAFTGMLGLSAWSFGFVVIYPALPVLVKSLFVSYSVFTLGAGLAGFGAFSSSFIPFIYLRNKESLSGFAVSLGLREQFGLVNQNGGLLKYSKEDTYFYETKKGNNQGTLHDIINPWTEKEMNNLTALLPETYKDKETFNKMGAEGRVKELKKIFKDSKDKASLQQIKRSASIIKSLTDISVTARVKKG